MGGWGCGNREPAPTAGRPNEDTVVITELVLLLGVLCFLSIRNDLVHRKGWLVSAIILWGATRILTELTFKTEFMTGQLRYDWGSLTSCVAAVCLFLCLLCIFLACIPSRRPVSRRPGDGSDQPGSSSLAPGPSEDASERLRDLVGDRP